MFSVLLTIFTDFMNRYYIHKFPNQNAETDLHTGVSLPSSQGLLVFLTSLVKLSSQNRIP